MPMLDRRVVVRILRFEENAYCEPSWIPEDLEVWASRHDIDLRRRIEEGGVTGDVGRIYRVRFDPDFLDAAPECLSVIDGPDTMSVQNVRASADRGPLRERNRFMELETLGAVR